MHLILTTIILTLLTQPVWANCDLTEEEGQCEVGDTGYLVFATGTGRSLSEAYCHALGRLQNPDVSIEFSSSLTEYNDGTKADVTEEISEQNICGLKILAQGMFEDTIVEDGVVQKSINKEKVTITRGKSLLVCDYSYEEDVDSETLIENFDESQNFYGNLIHPANPPKCGPEEKFLILESKQMGDGGYWSVQVAHRFKRSSD